MDMKYKIEGNHLIIYYNNGDVKEDATYNMNECSYCIHNPRTCNAYSPYHNVRRYGGQFCDSMRCIYEEV